MQPLAIVGATGSLGSQLLLRGLAAGHAVTAVVRSAARLPAGTRERVAAVRELDLAGAPVAAIAEALAGHGAVVSAAGHVDDGQAFVDLFGRLVEALESLPASARPVCWFLAGAAVLEIGHSGRRGIDLPVIGKRYWPHGANAERLARSPLDWRLLCPGPMVEAPLLGLAGLRVSFDRLPVEMPAWAERLPGPLATLAFARTVPQMTVAYADAADAVLAHLAPGGPASRRKLGLALPPGMRRTKR